jgi:hypothetical protein
MSFEQDVKSISLEANGDQSANQNRFMLLGADGIALNTVAGGPCIGVLQDKPTAGNIGAVAYSGVVKVTAGAVVVRGVDIQSDATGRAITAAAVDYSLGTALEAAGAAGDVIAVLLKPNAQKNV